LVDSAAAALVARELELLDVPRARVIHDGSQRSREAAAESFMNHAG
jgi:hypothetical protein